MGPVIFDRAKFYCTLVLLRHLEEERNKVKRKITLAILSRKKNKSNMKILKHIRDINLYCFAVISKPLKKGRIPKDNGGTKGNSNLIVKSNCHKH